MPRIANEREVVEPAFKWTVAHTVALVVLCCAQLIESLDVTVVNVALPAIREDVGFSESGLQWVVSAYTVMFGGFLLLGGRSGDLFGKRRIFVWGLGLFAASSILTGLAQSADFMVTGRALQGVSAAFVSPMTLAMIAVIFPEGWARNRAFGVWGTVTGISTSLGVIMGGLLTSGPGWRWIFFVNFPIVVALLVGALRYLPRDNRRATLRGFDFVGAMLVSAGTGTAVFACAQAANESWLSARTLGMLGASVGLLVGFIVYELKVARQPIVIFSIFRNRSVAGANIVAVFVGAALLSMFFCLSLYEQQVMGFSALKTGLSYLPLTAMLTLFAFAGPALVPKIGIRSVLVLGCLTATAGLVLFATASPGGGLFRNVILPSLVAGPGLALTFIPMSMAAVTGVGEADAGLASGVANMTRTLGGAVGLAIIATVASSRTLDRLDSGRTAVEATSDGFSLGFVLCACLMGCAAIASWALPGRLAPSTSDEGEMKLEMQSQDEDLSDVPVERS